MPFTNLTHDEMMKTLNAIDQALFYHDEWREALNRSLICKLSPDERDIGHEPHRACRFGQWLYCDGAKHLAWHPALPEIEEAHRCLHEQARSLLMRSADHERITVEDYERFVHSLKAMRLELQTTKREVEEAIYRLDPLTGTSNRNGMLTRLREQQALVERGLQCCCVLMLDLDHFKDVNDSCGHGVGDEVLATFGQQLRSQLRPYDLLFRYGGEEFLICLPNADAKSGPETAERLRQSLAAVCFKTGGAKTRHVTVSIGLSLLDPAVSVETSIERADQALYAAKAAGRDKVCIWDASMGFGDRRTSSAPKTRQPNSREWR